MKTKLQILKTTWLWCCLFLINAALSAQGSFCEDFNQYSTTTPVGTSCTGVCTPNLLNNWGAINIDGVHYTNVGSQGGTSDYFLYLDDGGCGNGATSAYNDLDFNGNWVEMVPQEEGCFCFDMKSFYIQTGTITGYNTLHIYNGPDLCSSALSATFVVSTPIDVSLGWQRVCAPIALSSGGVLPSNADGQWVVNTGLASDWDALITNVRSISFLVDVAGGDERWGIDNICISEVCDATIGQDEPTEEGSYCCDGKNEVVNGNFEFGNTGFNSAYTQTTATYPGEYDVTTSAANFGATITDHSYCDDPTAYATNDMFMVVNGKTQQSGSSIVWEQTLTNLEIGEEYKFCANFKDMEQCTFNIYPNITMSANGNSINQIIDTDDANPCDWQRLEICFIAEDDVTHLRIELDETGNGDGNDVAIDDIALMKKLDPNYFLTIQHQGDTNLITGSLNTMSTSDDILLNTECEENQLDDYYWFVYEPINPAGGVIDPGNIAAGTFGWSSNVTGSGPGVTPPWGLTTTFPNYPFAQNTFYVIGMYIPSCCESCYTESWEYQITYNNGMMPMNGEGFSDKMKAEIKSRFVMGDGVNTRGAENFETTKSVSIYPNPAQDTFTVSMIENTIKSVELISMTGQTVLTKKVGQEKSSEIIDISSLTSGMYFVNVLSTDLKNHTLKLIKK